MNALEKDYLYAVEMHSIEGIKGTLDAGLDPNAPIQGKTPIVWLTEMYSRSDRFPGCLRTLLDRGAVLDDAAVAPVLLDDAEALAAAIRRDPALLSSRVSMVSCFTPLIGAPLLHVAAEYGNVNAARVLIESGADVHAKAATDECGLNGHTALFHTVNSMCNRNEPIMRMLLDAGAKPDVRVEGIVWGKGFEWETTFFDLTPVSYAQMGLLPQVHRDETEIVANIKLLLQAAGRKIPPLGNVPNRYLKPKKKG